jgi:hypothetical protein
MSYTVYKYVSYILEHCEYIFRRFVKEFTSALKLNGKCEMEEIEIKFLSNLLYSCCAILLTLTPSLRNSEVAIVVHLEHLFTYATSPHWEVYQHTLQRCPFCHGHNITSIVTSHLSHMDSCIYYCFSTERNWIYCCHMVFVASEWRLE